MYSCVFWCEFIDLVVVFLGCYFLTTVNLISQKNPTKSMNYNQKTQEYIKGKSLLLIL